MSGNEGAPPTLQQRLLERTVREDGRTFLTLLDASGSADRYTYAELLDHAFTWTERFRSCGLSPGARIVVALSHSVDLYASYLGALLGGFVPAMFAFPSPKLSTAEY